MFATHFVALDPFQAIGDTLRIGGAEFTVRRGARGLTIGSVTTAPLLTEKRLTLRVGKGKAQRKVQVLVRPREKGAWEYAVLSAHRFDIAGESLVLIDADGNGEFEATEHDAYAAPGDPRLRPLAPSLVLGKHRLTIRELAKDGSSLSGELTKIKGASDQLDVLARVNRLRASAGLPAVDLDATLSANCTAHADYLGANGWSGYDDPHFEDPELDGYSEIGNVTAKRSLIMGAPHRYAIDAFWRTYYHRMPLLHPDLERIGVSTGHRWISVIDARGGRRKVIPPGEGWKDPILYPADGTSDFPIAFCRRGEAPEPVRRPWRRGNPLMLYFTFANPHVTAFSGELVKITEEGEEPVETLVPKTRFAVNARGLVPAQHLERATTYRVTYRFTRDDEVETHTATFRTAP